MHIIILLTVLFLICFIIVDINIFITENRTKLMSKYTRPTDLPGRVCRVLEGFTLLNDGDVDESFGDMVYD